MPKIIQFTHPGAEHSYDKATPNYKSWNCAKHKRKFLKANGKYISNDEELNGELAFWGEWEPPSKVSRLNSKPPKFYPKWLHEPLLPTSSLQSEGLKKGYQNTDPCVFGKEFKYFLCKQPKFKNKTLTQLAELEAGSVILFGSSASPRTAEAFFQLDTVFVVRDYIEYDTASSDLLTNNNLGNYNEYVLKTVLPMPKQKSLKLRLYFGATYQNSQNGMYSYSPSQLYNKQDKGFPRVKLKDLPFITNNLNAAPKITNTSLDEVKDFWEKIREISREEGCVEGVKFSYNEC